MNAKETKTIAVLFVFSNLFIFFNISFLRTNHQIETTNNFFDLTKTIDSMKETKHAFIGLTWLARIAFERVKTWYWVAINTCHCFAISEYNVIGWWSFLVTNLEKQNNDEVEFKRNLYVYWIMLTQVLMKRYDLFVQFRWQFSMCLVLRWIVCEGEI